MNSFFTLRVLLFAGECFAASVLLPALALLASRFLKQASLRHLVWLTVFGALAAFPLAALIVPSANVVIHHDAMPLSNVPVLALDAAPGPDAAPAVSVPAPAPAAPRALPSFDLNDIATASLVVWSAGVAWALLRLAAGFWRLSQLRRDSFPHPLREQFSGLISPCELLLSARGDGPVTWGVQRPVILLPRDSLHWRRERLEAVLLHEMAHVRRRDCLMQTLSQAVCAFYWPSTLMWIAAWALRRDAEIAADDAVIGAGIKPSAYAGELVQLASEFRGHGFASGVAIALPSSLETRVKSILALHQSRKGATSMDAFKIACFGIAATSLLALVRPDLVLAQDKAPAYVTAPVDSQTVDTQDVPPPPPVVETRDVPPSPPPVTPVSDTPPEPPAPLPVVDTPPVPPAPPAIADAPSAPVPPDGRHRHHRIVINIDGDITRAQLEATMAKAQEAQAKLAEIQPKIDAELARVDEMTTKAMKEAHPQIQAAIAKAQAQMLSAAKFARLEARINERVARELARAKPKIDAAIAKMRVTSDPDDESPQDTQVKP